jgi:hypothetical protein
MYIIRSMRVRWSAAALVLTLALSGACRNPFGREYEYEEQLYLSVDGSARITVDASLVALVALRGLTIDTSPRARLDRDELKAWYETGGCHVLSIGQPWYRHDRRFVQIQLSTDNIRALDNCVALNWSRYTLEPLGDRELQYRQLVGAAAGGDPGQVNWDGGELVAFKLHLPSKITFHNVRRLADHSTGDTERGNILTWEQRLADRRAGAPVDMQVHMERDSILYRTLWLFGGSFLAAVMVLIAIVWWVRRMGMKGQRAEGKGQK